MRVAFQIPFDATVRVSLDTNLCMISERTKETINGKDICDFIIMSYHPVLLVTPSLRGVPADESLTAYTASKTQHRSNSLDIHQCWDYALLCFHLMFLDLPTHPSPAHTNTLPQYEDSHTHTLTHSLPKIHTHAVTKTLCTVCTMPVATRWFRDPKVAVPLNEITRFPHAVLEVRNTMQCNTSLTALSLSLSPCIPATKRLLTVDSVSRSSCSC